MKYPLPGLLPCQPGSLQLLCPVGPIKDAFLTPSFNSFKINSTLEVLVISTLTLLKVTLTVTEFAETLANGNWSPMVLQHYETHVLLHRVEKSLERIEDGVIKERIKDFVELNLFLCTFNGDMNDNCVTGITVAVMAYIQHQTTSESFEYEYNTDE